MKSLVFLISLFLLSCLSCNNKKDITENNLTIASQMMDAWDKGDSLKMVTFFADDFLYEDIAYKVHIQSDKNELKKLVHQTITQVPDSRFKVLNKSANDSMTVMEWVWTGTAIGATRPFSGRGVSVTKIKNGKIVRNTDYYPLDTEYIKEVQENLASQSLQ